MKKLFTSAALLLALSLGLAHAEGYENGNLKVTLKTAIPTGTNVMGAVTQSGTWNIGTLTTLTGITNALPAGNNNIGDMDIASIAAGTNYIGRVRFTDGTLNLSLIDLTTRDAIPVAIVDGNGDQITSFGGGTQYTEADTDASITGTAFLWEDASDTLRAVSAAKPLPVSAASLPLPSGAATEASVDGLEASVDGLEGFTDGIEGLIGTTNTNTGASTTALQIMDDWDESDRAKVNLISGQAGITGGAGAVGASTPRITLASDDPGVVSLQLLDNAISGSGFNITQMNGVNISMGNGASGTGTQRVTLASDSTGQVALAAGSATIGALTANQTVNVAQINGVTPLMGNGASGTGAHRVTIANDSTGIVQPAAGTANGATPYTLTSAASTNATSVKGSAGNLYMATCSNTNAAARYFKIYNKASAPTVGTDTPILKFTCPGNTAGSGSNVPIPEVGLTFSSGIAFALTTGAADSDTGGVAASEVIINLGYK